MQRQATGVQAEVEVAAAAQEVLVVQRLTNSQATVATPTFKVQPKVIQSGVAVQRAASITLLVITLNTVAAAVQVDQIPTSLVVMAGVHCMAEVAVVVAVRPIMMEGLAETGVNIR